MNIFLALVCFTSFTTVDTAKVPTVYDTLSAELRIISYNDQKYRLQMDDTAKKYGAQSKQMVALYRRMAVQDSLDLMKVDSIIIRYGWLGPDQVGVDESETQFFVIQHADLKTQQRYLPVIRIAVTYGKVKPQHLALLEDRVALREGRKQIYGTQLSYPGYAVLPLEKPDSVDIRRASVGLGPLKVYLKECCNMDSVIFSKK